MTFNGESLIDAKPQNPHEVCPRCRTLIRDGNQHYSERLVGNLMWPRPSYFFMAERGPTHDEELWRWILRGGVDPGVTDDSQILRKRLQLATGGYDVFARSDGVGDVVTVEAWEPPEGGDHQFVVLLYRRDTGEIVSPDALPADEQRREEVLEYLGRFDRCRSESGEAVSSDALPVDEEKREEFLEYLRRFRRS